MAVQFRNAANDDAEGLRTFFSEMYSPDYVLSRDAAFMRWQFAAAPSANRAGLDLKLAVVDGAIAGCIGFIPIALSGAGAPVTAAWAANWMVDDRFRRLGLGPLLMRELGRDFDVVLALGGNRDAHALLPRMGWTDFGDLPRYVAILDADQARQLGDVSGQAVAPIPETAEGARVPVVPEEATALWDEVSVALIGTRRTADYLNWRYTEHPVFDYRIFELRRSGRLVGIGIYRLERVRDLPVTVARVVEVIAAPDDAGALLATLVHDAAGHGAALMDFFCPATTLRAPLEQARFSPGAGARFPILFQPIDRSRTGVLLMADVRKCAQAANREWYVTTADGDQDRPN
jgi:hypothetical protein